MPAGPAPTTSTVFLISAGTISISASRPAAGFTAHITGFRACPM